MEGTTLLTIAIPVLVALAALVLFTTARRRDSERALPHSEADEDLAGAQVAKGREVERQAVLARTSTGTALARADNAPLAPYVPPDAETIGVTRRQFLNRSTVAVAGFGLTGFGMACIAFLWPTLKGGFGSTIKVGTIDDTLASIRENRTPFYVPEGRFYINPFPADAVEAASKVYGPALLPGMEAGIVALYQKCVHLGCRVPWCLTSQWFECPCHGSQYNRVGEKKGGPAPRGLDHFPIKIEGGSITVDTGTTVKGPPIGTNSTGQEAEGPHCVTGGE